LVVSKQHTKHVLIFHQNVLDFLSSLLLVISHSLRLCHAYLGPIPGYWYCLLIEGDFLLWIVILAGKYNLVFVTIERYLKVVHAVWSKKKLRNWMLYLAMAFAWINSIVFLAATSILTTGVIDGVCYAVLLWESEAALFANSFFYISYFYGIIIIIFIVCYWRILAAVRRQARVMNSHGSSTIQAQTHQIQTNIIKTMILVSALFAVCDLPPNVFYIPVLMFSGILTRAKFMPDFCFATFSMKPECT